MQFTYDQAVKLMNAGHAIRRPGWGEAYASRLPHLILPRYFYEGKTKLRVRVWRPSKVERAASDYEDLGIIYWCDCEQCRKE